MKSTKLYFSALLCTLFLFTGCKDYVRGNGNSNDRPDIILTYPELVSMLQHYDKTRKQQFAAAVGKDEDTRINHFKLKDLKDYIAYIEKECKKKNIPLTGINFISGAYPDNYRLDPKKSNYQALIMMPATTIDGEENVSFDPFKSEKGKPLSLKEILEGYSYTSWTYDELKSRKSKKKSSRSTQKGGGNDLSPAGNRTGISPPN